MASNSYDLPKRPRFSWDIRTVPWTDGKGSQEDYVSSVTSWDSFHAKLPDSNSNKIPKGLRGIMLHSHLYGRAKDLCKDIPFAKISSNEGVQLICKALHKKDASSVVNTVYTDFMQLLATKRGITETCRNYESRFAASIAKLKSHASSALPESLTAFMLLANSNIEDNQRISILAAATANGATANTTTEATNEQLLDPLKYESIASIIRQCDINNKPVGGSVQANSGKFQKKKKKLTPEQLADLKSKSQCKKCQEWGHWQYDHNQDGSLKPGVKSTKEPTTYSKVQSRSSGRTKKSITFHMAKLSSFGAKIGDTSFPSPLLDDGAPYSGIGIHELKLLTPYLREKWDGKIHPIPAPISDKTHWQYGTGSHSSESRKMLGSVLLSAYLEDGTEISQSCCSRRIITVGDWTQCYCKVRHYSHKREFSETSKLSRDSDRKC